MSQSSSSTARNTVSAVHVEAVRSLTAEELLLAEVGRMCRDIELLPSSRALVALAAPKLGGAGQTSLARLEARSTAIAADLGLQAAVTIGARSELREASRLLRQARATFGTGDGARAESLAADGDRALRRAVAITGAKIRSEERTLQAGVAVDALRSMGFAVTVHEGRASTGLVGERGDEVFAALVHEGGVVETDQAGYEGGDCVPVLREFQSRMRQRGVVLEDTRRDAHGNARGGRLIRRAALAEPAGPLARGILRQCEEPGSVPAPSAPGASRRPIVIRPHRQGGGAR